MSVKVTVTTNLDQVTDFLDDFKLKALVGATRKAMNRSVMALRTQANRIVREERKLKQGEINKDYFKLKKASGRDLASMSASLEVSGKPVSLIRFVIGNRKVQSTKGIAVSARPEVKVEVKPGRRVIRRTAFIATGKSGNVHVFTRMGKERHPIKKQSTPALSVLLSREKHKMALESFAQQHFAKEFQHTFQWEVERLTRKAREVVK